MQKYSICYKLYDGEPGLLCSPHWCSRSIKFFSTKELLFEEMHLMNFGFVQAMAETFIKEHPEQNVSLGNLWFSREFRVFNKETRVFDLHEVIYEKVLG